MRKDKNKKTELEQQPENIPEELTSPEVNILPETETASTKQTTIDKQQTKKMEVHHHGHVHEKKKWKEYVFQFLMLFLAVFCGFLAEYQLEHKIEKERGRQYIYSFYEDLRTDTAEFSRIIILDEQKRLALADIFNCYETVRKNWKATSCLVPIERNSRFNIAANFSYGTTLQLKNAGGYRLLNKEDRDSIIVYDNAIQAYKDYESTVFQESQDIVRLTFSMLCDFTANKFLSREPLARNSSHTEIPLLFSDDKVLLNKYFNDLFRYRNAINGQLQRMKQFKVRAVRLIEYFKNKYGLK